MGNSESINYSFEAYVDSVIANLKHKKEEIEGPTYYISATAEECAICIIGNRIYLLYLEDGKMETKSEMFYSNSQDRSRKLQKAFAEVISRKKTPADAWETAKYIVGE